MCREVRPYSGGVKLDKNVCKGFVNCRHSEVRRVFPRPETELHAFNAGVVVFQVRRWQIQKVRDRAKAWILENAKTTERRDRVYTLGSNPPFMLAVGRRWVALDRRWLCGNQNFTARSC